MLNNLPRINCGTPRPLCVSANQQPRRQRKFVRAAMLTTQDSVGACQRGRDSQNHAVLLSLILGSGVPSVPLRFPTKFQLQARRSGIFRRALIQHGDGIWRHRQLALIYLDRALLRNNDAACLRNGENLLVITEIADDCDGTDLPLGRQGPD